MGSNLLITSFLAIALSVPQYGSPGAIDAAAAVADNHKFEEFMEKAQASFNTCDYHLASTFSKRARVEVKQESLIMKADSLYSLSEECRISRDSALFYRKRRHFGKAFAFYGNVVRLNRLDEECRNGYDTCYLFSHDKFEGMRRIKAGCYTVGRDGGPYCEGPQHSVRLEEFLMDEREVTVAEYVVFLNKCCNDVCGQACVDLGNPDCHVKETGGWYTAEKGYEDYPITCVSYFGAYYYAMWLGKALPTEYQFEAAWGKNTINCNHSQGVMPASCGAANEYQIMNLYGNVAEWCSDWYNPLLHRPAKAKAAHVNIDELKSIRGCAYDSPKDINPKTYREGASPMDMFSNVGFRCVINL